MQKEYAQGDTDQRINEITQAGFNDVVGIHRPDIDTPVDRQQYAGEGEQQDGFAVEYSLFEFSPILANGQNKGQEQ